MGWSKPCTQNVYRLNVDTIGWNRRVWNNGNGDSVPHGDVADIFVGPVDPVTGFPSHPNTPTVQDIDTTVTTVTNADYPNDGSDQMEIWGWLTLDAPALLRDVNGNTGERAEVWIGQCGGSPYRGEGYNDATTGDTASGDVGVLDPTPLPAGTHFVYARFSDFSAFMGLQLQTSVDNGGSWQAVSTVTPTAPVVECQQIDCCDPIPTGWDVCPPVECAAIHGMNPSGGSGVPVSTAIPIPDNEVDTAIRTGTAGTTGEAADAGHNHPIRRQGYPTTPTLALTSSAGSTMTAPALLDRWSDEEAVGFEWRATVSVQPSNAGWDFITVPSIAGFQVPRITVGTYRSTTGTPQADGPSGAGAEGAAPRGPYMGAEATHWSSTQRVYLGYYRRETAFTLYVMIRAEYTRV